MKLVSTLAIAAAITMTAATGAMADDHVDETGVPGPEQDPYTVSYTHLTLPTIA